MRKYQIFLILSIVIIMLFPVMASAHFLGYSSVDGDEIRYTDSTQYNDAYQWAVARWDALGAISILPDGLFTVNDLKWQDDNRNDVTWAGLYNYRGGIGQEDYITFNSYYVAAYSTSQKRNVATHELGHALGLGHSYSGQIMYAYVSSVTYIQSHDLADYNSLW